MDKYKYPLTKQFISWSRRGNLERHAILRELWDIDPHAARKLKDELERIGQEPIGATP